MGVVGEAELLGALLSGGLGWPIGLMALSVARPSSKAGDCAESTCRSGMR